MEMRKSNVCSLSDMVKMNWDNIKPANNPTITRMLTISTGVFTLLDIVDAVISQKYWVSVNYIGIGHFAVAIGEDIIAICQSAKTGMAERVEGIYNRLYQKKYKLFHTHQSNIFICYNSV